MLINNTLSLRCIKHQHIFELKLNNFQDVISDKGDMKYPPYSPPPPMVFLSDGPSPYGNDGC